MTPKEQEVAIGELEERVDRLRTLYEQYFLGFEKLEPMVPRKDVERRFVILRKEQIRNTAMRFRFNVVTQKYNTYSMHWVRICRQIEEGTYKRHVRRAQARFGDGRAIDRDISIDVDLGDFEDLDVDEVLAEADAAAAKYERREAPDTVPPPPPQARAFPMMTPGTSFAVGGRREVEVLDEMDPITPPPASAPPASAGGLRAARPAPLPPGAKPRIVRKVTRGPDESAPASQRSLPAAPPAYESAPASTRTPAPRLPAPSSPGLESSPRIPSAAQSAPRIRPRIAPIAGGSAGKIPAAPPSASPSVGRLPGSAPAAKPAPASSDPLGDKDTLPPPSMGPRSVPPGRPRAPLPLPSQLSQKKKE